jgi:Mrp family chromosome partitioning ATPase/uncharacterized protein involved in exopolysaccharide biosynthesis
MAVTTADEQTSSSPGLPFEPVTLLIGLILRWKVLVAAVVVSVALGVAAALILGKQTYEAETIALYKIPEKKDEAGSRTPPVSTQVWMVKLPSNLRAVSEKLQLGLEPKDLADIFQVRVEKRTSLLYITSQWNSAKMAADLANTLREVFIANQMALIKADAGSELTDLESRYQNAEKELKQADGKLQAFISENKIVDLGKEIQWNMDRLTSVELLLSNSRNELDTIETQKESLRERIEAMKLKISEEQSVSKAGKSLADLNIRIERLRRAIHDDKEVRKNSVELEKEQLAYERSKELFAKGLISQQDYQKSKAQYEEQEVKTVDTDQIREWKRQLKVLEGEVIPEKEDFKSPSQELLRSLQLKALDMDLQELSLKKKVTYVNDQISRIKSRLEELTALQRQQTALTKEVTACDSKKGELEQLLAKTRKDYESPDPGFVVVSQASAPTQSNKSNRKILFAAIVFLGTMIGSIVVLASELLDTTIKSGAEVQSKFSKPVIGIIPKVKGQQRLLPDNPNFPLIEMFRIISVHVRREIPRRGARIMITSADRWEGRTLVTANLAACLGRQDERALVIDAQIRPVQSELDLRYMIAEKDKPLKGLGEWLSFEVNELGEIVWPTVLAGVECVPRVEAAVTPDLLGSHRMKELMEGLSEHFSLILVDGPPVASYVDAELVAQWCDAVIFVVRSRACTSSALKRSVERIGGTGVPLAGFIVNDVDQLYLKWA